MPKGMNKESYGSMSSCIAAAKGDAKKMAACQAHFNNPMKQKGNMNPSRPMGGKKGY